ncbi:MAG: hypothetical protein COA94_05965 [Rickettsiales bacterium]|nr:MAG: hypothetical protein COA94_05965 [Rickettsiales bacterium]
MNAEFLPKYLALVREHNKLHNPQPGEQHTRLLRSILGCAAESGELASAAMQSISNNCDIDPLEALDEFGDVLFNLVRGLDALGFDLELAMMANSSKLISRALRGKNKPSERRVLENLVSEVACDS